MHQVFENYTGDPRMFLVGAPPSRLGVSEDTAKCYLYAKDAILDTEWHWLKYHYNFLPPTQPTLEIAEVCVLAEHSVPGLGKIYIDTLASIKDRDRDKRNYESMLQLFAEMLVLDAVFQLAWSDAVVFEYEPAGKTGQRPELRVTDRGQRYFFEVKAPSLIDHAEQRQKNGWQVPGRILSRELIEQLSRGEPVVLPRDNPIKDFLASAEKKFGDFDKEQGANLLVIVWDDFIYEPITSLANEKSGLLTENTYHRNNDEPVTYPNVDAVVVVRHLNYFIAALAERPLLDRRGAFDFGGMDNLPNVSFSTEWGRPVPNFIFDGLRAVDVRDVRINNFADYRPQEVIMWIGETN